MKTAQEDRGSPSSPPGDSTPPAGQETLDSIFGPAPKKKSKDPGPVVALWRELCVPAGMPDVNPGAWGKATQKKVAKAAVDLEDTRTLFERASKCSHLCGDNDRGWCADLLWVLTTGRERIELGRYDNRTYNGSETWKTEVNPEGINPLSFLTSY